MVDGTVPRRVEVAVLRDSFAWKPTADAYKGDTLVLRIEVPGIDPDKDIEISLTENMLHIKGQKSGKGALRGRPLHE